MNIQTVRWLLVFLLAILLSGCQPTEETPPPAAITDSPKETAPSPTAAARQDSSSGGGNADVVFVEAVQEEQGTWTFHVTVEHPDTGWEDYADGWDVVLTDGTVLKPDPEDPFTRLLLHPHVEEQPFRRSQRGIEIPEGTPAVVVRAHDLVDGFGGKEITVNLTREQGPGYEVQR